MVGKAQMYTTTQEQEILIQILRDEYKKIPNMPIPGWLHVGDHIWHCLTYTAVKLAHDTPYEQIPLHINTPSMYEKAVVLWRLKLGR